VTILAERLKLAAESEKSQGGHRMTKRVSCGVAVFPDDGASAHDVMREADVAMYRAKQRSRRSEKTESVAGRFPYFRLQPTRRQAQSDSIDGLLPGRRRLLPRLRVEILISQRKMQSASKGCTY